MDSGAIFILFLAAGFFAFIGYLAVLSRKTERRKPDMEPKEKAS